VEILEVALHPQKRFVLALSRYVQEEGGEGGREGGGAVRGEGGDEISDI